MKNKMKSKLKNFLSGLLIAGAFALPMKTNAQTRPINQPTPTVVFGNFFRRPYINYEVGRDSSDFYDSNGVNWDTLKTRKERISLLEKILPVEYKLRKTQNYHGFDYVQAFINFYGISNVRKWNIKGINHGGNSYDTTSNARFNLPVAIVETFDKNNFYTHRVNGVLVGEDPLRYKNWYFFDPADSDKEINISNSKYVSINLTGYVFDKVFKDSIFTFIPNIVKFGLENGIQKDTISIDAFLWRNSPNTTTLFLKAPKDTTIKYKKGMNLLDENLGKVEVKTNLKLGENFHFHAKNEYAGNWFVGEVYIKKKSSLEDTVYTGDDKKSFKVKKKTVVDLIEKTTLYNSLFIRGVPYEHTIIKDSVYQNIQADVETSVGNVGNDVPKRFEVSQNFPNPFNPSTTIRYELPKETYVRINIYNLLGQKVKTLVNSDKEAGTYNTIWNGRDNYGNEVASGIYIYRVTAGSHVISKKMILMK